jgi:hypothetical protein
MKKPLKIVLAVLAVLVIGGAIGYGTAVAAYDSMYSRGNVRNGQWETNLSAGSSEAGMYTRAQIALHALLALARSEAVYYQCAGDNRGEQLRAACDYRIDGKPLDARWWSITVYGKDDFLIPNELRRYSFNTNTVKLNSDGSYVIYLSALPKEGNWLPAGTQDQKVVLMLRLYNPGQSVYDNPGGIELPRITREGCK